MFVNQENNQQIGCLIQDISDEAHTTLNGYFHFDEKICQYKRKPNEIFHHVREEVKLKYVAISLCETSEIALTFYQKSTQQTLKPQETILVFYDKVEAAKFVSSEKPNLGRWQTIFLPHGETLTSGVLPFVHNNLLWVTDVDDPAPINFWEELDNKVNDQGFRFKCIADKDNKRFIASKQLYEINPLPFDQFIESIGEKDDYDCLSKQAKRNFTGTSKRSCKRGKCGCSTGP